MYWKFIEALRHQRATELEILLVLLALIGIVLFFVLRYTWEQRSIQRQQKRGAYSSFLNACREKGLVPAEVNLLLDRARAIGREADASLVESNVIFDQFAHLVMQSVGEKEIRQMNLRLTALRHKLGFRPPSRGLALNSSRELPPGQTLYLVLPTNVFLVGRILDIDETMMMVRLRAGTPRARLEAGITVTIHFNRSGDARYSGSSRILDTRSDEEGQHVILSHSPELRRDQRRKDFRIDEDRNVCCWVVDEQLAEAEDPFRVLDDRMPERAHLQDLSGGGASILIPRDMSINQGLYINLDPTAVDNLPIVRGTVIRTNPAPRTDRWALSVRFEDLRPSEHQKIVSYVFRKERETLQNAYPSESRRQSQNNLIDVNAINR